MTNQEKLDEMYDKVNNMHDIIKGMRSRERIGNIMKVLYWIIILGLAFGAYYYVKPVVDTVAPQIEGMQRGLGQIEAISKQFPEVGAIKGAYQSFKNKYSN